MIRKIIILLLAISSLVIILTSEARADVIENATEEDMEILTNFVYLYGVQRNLPKDCLQGLVEIVCNDVENGRQDSIKAVITEPGRYHADFYKDYKISEKQLRRIDKAVQAAKTSPILPTTYNTFDSKVKTNVDNPLWVGKTKNDECVIGYGLFFGTQPEL